MAFSSPMRALRSLPEAIRGSTNMLPDIPVFGEPLTTGGEVQHVNAQSAERLSDVVGSVTYRLFGVFPLRTVRLISGEEVRLMPGGTAVGIAIRTEGVLVVGLAGVDTVDGTAHPGAAAGLAAGDVILTADGQTLKDAAQLSVICSACRGTLELTVRRKEQTLTLTAMPAVSKDGIKRLGVWVRDSTAGVGTVSFYDGVTKRFAALGHAVSDVDTHSLLTIREGRLLPSEIVSVVPGAEGAPGELTGAFSVTGESLGVIEKNTEYGIFGKLFSDYENGLCGELPLAEPDEVHVGGASLLSTIPGGGVRSFSCDITRVSSQTSPAPKGLVIEVTDPRLISSAGGIVQGMSGSPVLQDGKLCGVITHVFVNDPLRGYCVYAKWMFEQMNAAA